MNNSLIVHFVEVLARLTEASTVVLLAAWAFAAMTRRNAALRHLAWVIAFAFLVFAPVLSLLSLPKVAINIPLVSAIPVVQTRAAAPVAEIPLPTLQHVSDSPIESKVATAAPAVLPARHSASKSPEPARPPLALLVIWALGAAGVGLWVLAARWGIRTIREKSTVEDGNTVGLGRLAARLSVRRWVQLRVGDEHGPEGAMTWGTARPVILLPHGMPAWSKPRLEAVLLHEIAHVKRLDSLSQALAVLVCAIHWFNPLVWISARAMRLDSEAACDNAVVRAGVPAVDYAAELLAFAAELGNRRCRVPHLGVSMAGKPGIESRIRSILDPKNRRLSLTWNQFGLLFGGATLILFLALCVQPSISRREKVRESLYDEALYVLTLHERSNHKPFSSMKKTDGPSAAAIVAERQLKQKMAAESAASKSHPECNCVHPPLRAADLNRRPLLKPGVGPWVDQSAEHSVSLESAGALLSSGNPGLAMTSSPAVGPGTAPLRVPVAARKAFQVRVPVVVLKPFNLRAPMVSRAWTRPVVDVGEPAKPAAFLAASRPGQTNTIDLPPFSRIDAGANVRIAFKSGPRCFLHYGSSRNDKLSTHVENGVLHLDNPTQGETPVEVQGPELDGIRLSSGARGAFNVASRHPLAAEIDGASSATITGSASQLTFRLAGSSRLSVLGSYPSGLTGALDGQSTLAVGGATGIVTLTENGASSADLGVVKAKVMTISMDGSSSLSASGHAKVLTTSLSGSSTAFFQSLRSGSASVKASGSSRASLGSTRSLWAQASGASLVTYAGDPKSVTRQVSDTSDVRPQ